MSGSLPQFGGAIGGTWFGGAAPTFPLTKILGVTERELVFARRERAPVRNITIRPAKRPS
jgi:hypothetical protein